MDFRWNDWNIAHIAEHGVTPEEAEEVVSATRRPFPRKIEDDKWFVWGKTGAGRFLQVIYVEDDYPSDSVYIIHARPLSATEKRRLRKQTR